MVSMCTSIHDIQCTVPEASNIIDKYAVSVQRDDEVVGHKKSTVNRAVLQRVFYFLCADKKNKLEYSRFVTSNKFNVLIYSICIFLLVTSLKCGSSY